MTQPARVMTDTEEFLARQEFLLTVLSDLHLDYAALGLLREAGPLLHRLMELAGDAKPDAVVAARSVCR